MTILDSDVPTPYWRSFASMRAERDGQPYVRYWSVRRQQWADVYCRSAVSEEEFEDLDRHDRALICRLPDVIDDLDEPFYFDDPESWT